MGTENWLSDSNHSELTFKIRHLMISNVTGKFRDVTATAVTLNNDFSKGYFTLKAVVSSLTTENEQRDQHLLNADFFDAENFPEINFVSTYIEENGKDSFTLDGDLSMKGITKPVSLQVEFGGLITDDRHGTKAGFTITGTLHRSDWGISFNRILDTGGVGLGEDVKIFSEIQLVKQK
jgi:polyisoprenoid-binding protein YceI